MTTQGTYGANATVRAAVVAGSPEELATRLADLETALQTPSWEANDRMEADGGEWIVCRRTTRSRLGFLMPGQGSQPLILS